MLEADYLSFATDPGKLWGTDETITRTGYYLPLMLWTELKPKYRFGPYLKIGLGWMWVDMRDDCSDAYWNQFAPHHMFWSFAYGIGGGLYYHVNDRFDVLLQTKRITCTEDNELPDSYREPILLAPWENRTYGVVFRYYF